MELEFSVGLKLLLKSSDNGANSDAQGWAGVQPLADSSAKPFEIKGYINASSVLLDHVYSVLQLVKSS